MKVLSTIFICVRKQQQLKWSQQNLPEKVCHKKIIRKQRPILNTTRFDGDIVWLVSHCLLEGFPVSMVNNAATTTTVGYPLVRNYYLRCNILLPGIFLIILLKGVFSTPLRVVQALRQSSHPSCSTITLATSLHQITILEYIELVLHVVLPYVAIHA